MGPKFDSRTSSEGWMSFFQLANDFPAETDFPGKTGYLDTE